VLVAAVQMRPAVPVHALFPQMQGAALLEVDPSVFVQAEAVTPEAWNRPSLLHVLSAAMQNMPVVAAVSQSTLPHAQADGLAAEPSVVAQTGPLRHLFWDASQCMPVVIALVHALFPQMQGAALLGAEPSVFVQAEAVTPEEA